MKRTRDVKPKERAVARAPEDRQIDRGIALADVLLAAWGSVMALPVLDYLSPCRQSDSRSAPARWASLMSQIPAGAPIGGLRDKSRAMQS